MYVIFDLIHEAQRWHDVTRRKEQVKKNGSILRGFIDAVCYLVNQELPFRGNDGSSASLSKANFVEFLIVLKNLDPLLENHKNSATVI